MNQSDSSVALYRMAQQQKYPTKYNLSISNNQMIRLHIPRCYIIIQIQRNNDAFDCHRRSIETV